MTLYSYLQIAIISICNPPELSATLSALGPFIQDLAIPLNIFTSQ